MDKAALRFQVGGTVNPRLGVYVQREEDRDFLQLASKPQAWINVHGCRTMGKSSLYAQHRHTLQRRGVRMVAIDMAAQIGHQQSTGRDWVISLAEAVSAELEIERQLIVDSISSLPNYVTVGTAFERLFLNTVFRNYEERLLFVFDEYDYVRRLEYCDDILFGLRHLQSLQARTDVLDHLSMCFVGLQPLTYLATAGAANMAPIANSIEMADFPITKGTVDALKAGFPSTDRSLNTVVRRILQLSGGQPLVTMEILNAAQRQGCLTVAGVDLMTRELVATSGQGKDLQLFEAIERALIAEGGKSFAALRAYESLLQGSRESHTAPGVDLLLLVGLVRRRKGILEAKGELFERRFDSAWAKRMLSRIAVQITQYRGRAKTKGKKICVINTGGTLGMVQKGDKVVPPQDAEEFRNQFTFLDSIAEEVAFINLITPPRDSINIFPDQWTTIARYIYLRRKDGFQGFVVVHGTDTMAYTASAVAFALGRNLCFPVVFTGAQTTPDVAYGDAHVNLYRACEVATKDIPEVVISFGNFVFRAVRAQKKDDRRFDGFESPTYPPLAEITGEINVRRELLRPMPKSAKDIDLRDEFESSILIVPQFPGLEPDFFEHLLQEYNGQLSCNGVIVQTLGAGNVASEPPYSFIPFVEQAYRQGIPVIVTSQYPPDPGTHTKYTPAEAPINAGAVHAGNMTQSAAVAKFRWVLANVQRRKAWNRMPSSEKRNLVSRLMVGKPIIGEF